MRKFLSVFLALTVVFCLAPAALAAQDSVSSAPIPVEVKLSGTAPSSAETYTIALKPDDNANPMPEGTGTEVENLYSLKITGAASGTIPSISFSTPGTYTYILYQIAGTNASCQSYDKTIYHVTVTVTRSAATKTLVAMLTMHVEGVTTKPDTALFTNVYKQVSASASASTPQTDDPTNYPTYLAVSAVSIGVLVALFLTRKRKDPGEEQ